LKKSFFFVFDLLISFISRGQKPRFRNTRSQHSFVFSVLSPEWVGLTALAEALASWKEAMNRGEPNSGGGYWGRRFFISDGFTFYAM